MDKPLTRNIRPGQEAPDLAQYEKSGGYEALKMAIGKMTPQEVGVMVRDSNLRGRGGAGFPTGRKWAGVPMGPDAPKHKYLIADADEMEPGTFKDRLLLEGDPHQFIEGMILGSYAIRADTAFIFLRRSYVLAAQRIRRAIAEAYEKNYLGNNILGSDYSLDLYLHISAGRYICGEASALTNALEGYRANPRAKTPHQTEAGLWGEPTDINNVETLCNVPHIIKNGAEWYKSLGLTDDAGTKIYGVSGKVKNPGAWELPMGTPLREILEEHAGGMRAGLKFRGVLPGGASSDFLVEKHLDVPMDFDNVRKAGSRLGTGTMIVLDDKTCPVGMVHNLLAFFARESCGWCTPCREGLPWTRNILHAIENGEGQAGDLERLALNTKLLGPGHTFCALAPGAMEPLQSALKYFRDDFKQHIEKQRCPWR
jgi:NADH-quinone oxidoreductase subunit F